MAAPITPREYDVGNEITTTVRFRVHGVLSDPTTVTIKVKPPTGSVVVKSYPSDPEVVRTAQGEFTYAIALAISGSWSYRWEAAGAVRAAAERNLYVRVSEF